MQTVTLEKKGKPMILLPHQKRLKQHLSEMSFPFYIYWGMGSGKTIGGCICLQLAQDKELCLIICDKSLVSQWCKEIGRFVGRNHLEFNDISIHVMHYEHLEKDEEIDLSIYSVIVVDEAHRFRNAWQRNSERMLSWIERIHSCSRVVFLSGTPIVNDAVIEMHAFQQLMQSDAPIGRISYYDPRTDIKTRGYYASTEHLTEYCFMSWAQCFKYLVNRRQSFELQLEDENIKRIRTTSKQFAYNTHLRSVCNNPYPNNPELSPKLLCIRDNIQAYKDQQMKQIVYSSRRDAGINALDDILEDTTYRIDGSMSIEERSESIRTFNLKPNAILLITDAGGQGVDLKRVDVVHLFEPADSIQEENQIINRAVRYKSHRENYSKVLIVHYIIRFPTNKQVCAPWKKELYDSGLFAKEEMIGLSRKVQKSLQNIIKTEENDMTLDEKVFINREVKEAVVQTALKTIQSWCIS